ncbi:nicotinate mononucleotide-dependent phosphoribosyltransferase CobT [Gloeocapsa sp. PCC 73106]|uniref:nicotinate mononucleotide-dependent phosphoribosyltransferase CobT n=1 Tax=Gloeocapsa sp. PCC 73106 TaxID=102232 RepID=UPI0002ABDC66|nr:TIGR00303 family protein [Gloeocapsa sp. PCC 73106]ELR96725.1 TIGR00303 family protein [Gloeocapsa sp. PCC 73106]
MIKVYHSLEQGQEWLANYRGKKPVFACILGFTATGLIPGISAAGATPALRQYTAIADAEFLINGPNLPPRYPLPSLDVGASPVLITRAVVEGLAIPVYLFNAGLPTPPPVPAIDLGGIPALCVSSGKALPLEVVEHLFAQGMAWGEKLGKTLSESYLIIGECVVGGTTTALGLLTGLGINATGKVNSSHRQCNHEQKWSIVRKGLEGLKPRLGPLEVVAGVGDPMQIVAAGMAIAASAYCGVMLAGGTQMLAVYALINALVRESLQLPDWRRIVVGTTRWVVEDSTGDTLGLAREIQNYYKNPNLGVIATQLSFANSQYETLRDYERGYVKEGVGAGACAIAAHLYQNWSQLELQSAIESIIGVASSG